MRFAVLPSRGEKSYLDLTYKHCSTWEKQESFKGNTYGRQSSFDEVPIINSDLWWGVPQVLAQTSCYENYFPIFWKFCSQLFCENLRSDPTLASVAGHSYCLLEVMELGKLCMKCKGADRNNPKLGWERRTMSKPCYTDGLVVLFSQRFA